MRISDWSSDVCSSDLVNHVDRGLDECAQLYLAAFDHGFLQLEEHVGRQRDQHDREREGDQREFFADGETLEHWDTRLAGRSDQVLSPRSYRPVYLDRKIVW